MKKNFSKRSLVVGSAVACFLVSSALVQNVHADDLFTVTSLSTNFIAMTSKLSFDKTVALYGENLDYLLFNDVTVVLGHEVGSDFKGNDSAVNVTFSLTPKEFVHGKEYSIQIYEGTVRPDKNGDVVGAEPLVTVDQKIFVSNPLYSDHVVKKPRRFLQKSKSRHASKRNIGLNVHWGLGAEAGEVSSSGELEDDLFERKLSNSKTKWAREHFSYAEVMGDNQRGWFERYDEIMLKYQEQNIRVVAMLAYGEEGNEVVPPSAEDWEDFVRFIVQRYRNSIDVYEIWNEPDSQSYMNPNTVSVLKPLLKAAYPLIKHYDPKSIVVNGPIGDVTNTAFVKKLYKKAGKYFDELSIHLYYCDEYVDNGNNGKLWEDLDELFTVIPKKRQSEKIWITELGCSLGTDGVDQVLQRRYLKQTTRALLKTGKFRAILLYTIRDRPYLNSYEANFGLMDENGLNKPAWKWFRRLPKR